MLTLIFNTIVIPLFLILIVHYHEQKNIIDEYDIQLFLYTIVTLIVINSALYLVSYYGYQFNEVLNCKIQYVQYQEEWTEYRTRTETYPCGTDSKGNTQWCTRIVPYTEELGPYWDAIDEYGYKHSISRETYNSWKQIWGTEKKTGVNEGSAAGWDRVITGDIFQADWNSQYKDIYPHSRIHKYTNKVRVSDSIFKQKGIDREIIKKYYRPADKSIVEGLISYDIELTDYDKWQFRILNASLGKSKEVHGLTILVKDKPISEADLIVNAWGGPNKNELCTFIGIKDNKIEWIRVFSWCDDTTIHAQIRQDITLGEEFNSAKICPILKENIKQYWKRKEFKDFNYIKSSVSLNIILFSFISNIIAAGIVYYIWKNHVNQN